MAVRIVTAGARLMTCGCALVLALVAGTAAAFLSASVRFMATRAVLVLNGCVFLIRVAARAVEASFARVVRQVAMTILAFAVPLIGMGAGVFALVAIAAQVRRGDALHEAVGAVALGTS